MHLSLLRLQSHSNCSFVCLLLPGAGDDSAMKPWLDRLASNLKREHVLRVMLNSFVWGKIFTPVQCAKAAVYRWAGRRGAQQHV
jgi:hypothetical protein